MSQPININICSRCSHPIFHLVNFDIYLCDTCVANAEEEIVDDINELIIPILKKSTAIDYCENDAIILKKNDDLYVSNNGLIKEIRSSITFEMVPNYIYNETTKLIEKIDATIEEEDRRLIVLQRNPNAILEEDFKKYKVI